jgi:hypothetical protein
MKRKGKNICKNKKWFFFFILTGFFGVFYLATHKCAHNNFTTQNTVYTFDQHSQTIRGLIALSYPILHIFSNSFVMTQAYLTLHIPPRKQIKCLKYTRDLVFLEEF